MATAEINVDVLRKQIFEQSKVIIDAAIAEAVALEVQKSDHARDELLEALLENVGDTWDRDAAAESIAVEYVRHLEKLADEHGLDRRHESFHDGDALPPARQRIADLQRLAEAMLATFSNRGGDGYRARVGQVTHARWTAILNGEQP